jgi:hypothetical protein
MTIFLSSKTNPRNLPYTANASVNVKSNITQQKTKIPWSNLPQKFSGHFPVRYVWIDALCIVEDDDEDKMRAKGEGIEDLPSLVYKFIEKDIIY